MTSTTRAVSPSLPAPATGARQDSPRARHAVTESGDPAAAPLVLIHGFGCDQGMWRRVLPRLEAGHRVIRYDLMGSGSSAVDGYDPARYDSLHGHADDLVALMHDMDLRDAVLVGHSVSAMIALLATIDEPERVRAVVMVGPSPRYLDDPTEGYVGGFTRDDIDGLLSAVRSNFVEWSEAMAPVIMGNGERPELARELADTFCRTDPDVAAHFAEVTFLSDNRRDLCQLNVPALVLQCRDDVIAPLHIGQYLVAHLPRASLVVLDVVGHCPHVSDPEAVTGAIESFITGLDHET